MSQSPKVGIIMGSQSDWATMKHAARVHGTDDTYGGVFGVLGTLTDLMTIVGPLLFLNVYGVDPGAVFPAMAVIGTVFAGGYVWFGRSGIRRSPATGLG